MQIRGMCTNGTKVPNRPKLPHQDHGYDGQANFEACQKSIASVHIGVNTRHRGTACGVILPRPRAKSANGRTRGSALISARQIDPATLTTGPVVRSSRSEMAVVILLSCVPQTRPTPAIKHYATEANLAAEQVNKPGRLEARRASGHSPSRHTLRSSLTGHRLAPDHLMPQTLLSNAASSQASFRHKPSKQTQFQKSVPRSVNRPERLTPAQSLDVGGAGDDGANCLLGRADPLGWPPSRVIQDAALKRHAQTTRSPQAEHVFA